MSHRLARLILLLLLVAGGLVLQLAGLLDAEKLIALTGDFSASWWLVLILVLAQAILFTFALAGSLFLWVAAPLYPPLVAALILAVGGTLGGLGAYLLSRSLTVDWKRRIEQSRAYRLLHSRGDFFSLFAMRVFPGFPHALVNYSAGILRARLDHFAIAAMLGIFIKSFIYARVIHSASNELSLLALLDLTVIGPLLLLAAISVAAVLVTRRVA
ncbi:MAG: VTT domain-containing protein [Gammaproteobacteria bacterium]|jgi:uncharacterized membrane protein YdjX (TVP38/TMEM64 family)